MGDGNKHLVSFEKSAKADVNNMNPTCSSTSNNRLKLQKRPDSLKIELLQSVRNSYFYNPNDVNISFRNITYTVKHGLFFNKNKRIIKNLNGTFNGGELIALMGPSGAGKTTLMKILAGYTTSGVTGDLLLNQDVRDERIFRKNSCFIMQDDNLQPLLTVNEAMNIAANLKFNSTLNHKEQQEKVEEVMKSLGLWDCRSIRTKSLSGGQRKRLAIGVELLNNPRIMFFDEPISGLDSSTSKQCIMLLKQLAQEGRIIICTIHQPSAIIFEIFDSLYVMANGYCIYQGSVKGLVPYLSETGFDCPPYHNPADYLLEVASGDYGDHTETLRNKCENGLCQDWARNQRDTIQLQSLEHVGKMMSSGLITPVKAPNIKFELLSEDKSKKKNGKEKIYDTNFFTQLYVLFKRTCLILSRDPTLTYSRIITHIAIALFIGILYFDIGKDASNALNNCNYILFSNLFLMYTAFSSVITTFPLDLPILIRERFNRWYSLKTYFLAITFADLPVQMLATLSYVLITYFMTAQPLELIRISSFIFVCVLISLTAQSFGLIIGAIMSIQDAVIFGPFSILPFLMFSGFFVRMRDAQVFLRWMFHISFVKYGWEGLMLSIFGYNREKMPCSTDYCHFVYPEKFLEEVQMNEASYGFCVIFLIGLTIFLRIIAFFALKIKLWIRT